MAGLHREILAGIPAVAGLARFFPTVSGEVPPAVTTELSHCLRQAILDRREMLAPFIRESTVQTNETARGLVWLLPLAQVSWPAVHLVELGASAGLNLVAERRNYRMFDDATPPRPIGEFGNGVPPQFATICRGRGPAFIRYGRFPVILSRTGIDLAPFLLRSAADELTLSAFIWGDQPARLERLREGIAALQAVESSKASVRLQTVHLPDELPSFLDSLTPLVEGAPVAIYNTTMTMYLADEGRSLRVIIDAWARRRREPVIWLQWEPPQTGEPPAYAFQAWTADLWQAGNHYQWQLAWVHPHGTTLEWRPDAYDFGVISMQI
jgi:hypothetical protein